MCVGFVTFTFTLDFHTICTQNLKTTFDRVLSRRRWERSFVGVLSGIMKIYAGFFFIDNFNC